MSSVTPEPGFEEVVQRLEVIAKRLESGQPKLEEALSLFEEGVKLAREGQSQLDAAEKRIEVLLQDGSTQEFRPAVPSGE